VVLPSTFQDSQGHRRSDASAAAVRGSTERVVAVSSPRTFATSNNGPIGAVVAGVTWGG